jgi:hypothetical protein
MTPERIASALMMAKQALEASQSAKSDANVVSLAGHLVLGMTFEENQAIVSSLLDRIGQLLEKGQR